MCPKLEGSTLLGTFVVLKDCPLFVTVIEQKAGLFCRCQNFYSYWTYFLRIWFEDNNWWKQFQGHSSNREDELQGKARDRKSWNIFASLQQKLAERKKSMARQFSWKWLNCRNAITLFGLVSNCSLAPWSDWPEHFRPQFSTHCVSSPIYLPSTHTRANTWNLMDMSY